MVVRLTGAPSPRVSDAADRSSPICTAHEMSGTRRYSTSDTGPALPSLRLRMRMAEPTARASSPRVGKKRNSTDSGMTSHCGACTRSAAAMNSDTVVVANTKYAVAMVGRKREAIMHEATIAKFKGPSTRGTASAVRLHDAA